MTTDTYIPPEQQRLQKWANANVPDEKLIYKAGFWDQVVFMRDTMAGVLSRTFPEYQDLWDVSGDHTSKSVKLPVFEGRFGKQGVVMQARYNFHDWNVSIKAPMPLTPDWLDLIQDDDGSYLFFQGMSRIYKPYNRKTNNQQFSFYVSNRYELYTVARILRQYLGIKKED